MKETSSNLLLPASLSFSMQRVLVCQMSIAESSPASLCRRFSGDAHCLKIDASGEFSTCVL